MLHPKLIYTRCKLIATQNSTQLFYTLQFTYNCFFDSTFHASSDIASAAFFTAASASDASSVAFVVVVNAKM